MEVFRMRTGTSRALLIGGVVTLIVAGAIAILLYRASETEASSYELQAARWWAIAAGGYSSFADQIMSLRVEPASIEAVCHDTKVQLQNLNSISLAGAVPATYTDFNRTFMDAVSANKRYYRRILQLCSNGMEGDATLLASLFTLGKDTEDRYRQAYALMPDIGSQVEPGTYSEVNEKLSKIFQSGPKKVQQEPKVKVVEVPRTGYSPSFPPAIGSIVVVETPLGIGLNLRVAPSVNASLVQNRALVRSGEKVVVLNRAGNWLFVQTEDGYYGYVRWWYEGTPRVRP
jgi:hypothetical protein